jgi:ParB family chromosome partitioning protein
MNFPALSTIPLDLITDDNHWNIHPFLRSSCPPDLVESFKTAGILHPPLVYELEDGRYELIAGRRRLVATREILGLTACPCYIAPLPTLPQTLLSLLIEDQSLSNPFSVMETAHFFRIGRQYLPDDELAKLYLPRLTGKTNTSLLKSYRLLLSLEDEIQQFVHDSFITENMAYELVKLSPVDRLSLLGIFRDFQLGGGKQKRLYSLLRDITCRQETGISALLQELAVREILQHKEMNKPQKIQALMVLLQQMATPSLTADEEQFRSAINKLKLPACCAVQHSPAFETDAVELTIRFDDLDRLLRSWPALREVLPQG